MDQNIMPATDTSLAAHAFADLRAEVSLLRRAVERLTDERTSQPDYAPSLEDIAKRLSNFGHWAKQIAATPNLTLTPDTLSREIDVAAKRVREADHRAWRDAVGHLLGVVQSLQDMMASAATATQQRQWIAGAAAIAIVVGFAFGSVVPTRIAQMAPESWYWPEQRAADTLGRDGWTAGRRLLQVSNPEEWNAMVSATRLARQNAEKLSECAARAAKAGEPVTCSVSVFPVGKPVAR